MLNDLTAILFLGSLDLLLQMLAEVSAATPTWESPPTSLCNFPLGSETSVCGRINLVCEG